MDSIVSSNGNNKMTKHINRKAVYIFFLIMCLTLFTLFDSKFRHDTQVANESIRMMISSLSRIDAPASIKKATTVEFVQFVENEQVKSNIKDYFVFGSILLLIIIIIVVIENYNLLDEPTDIDDTNASLSTDTSLKPKSIRHSRRRYYKNYYK